MPQGPFGLIHARALFCHLPSRNDVLRRLAGEHRADAAQDGLAAETNDPTLAEIEAVFPGWYVWQGVNGMLYVQLRPSSPPITFREENGTELRARIASWCRVNPPRPVVGSWPGFSGWL
jgi:hypothetical protein